MIERKVCRKAHLLVLCTKSRLSPMKSFYCKQNKKVAGKVFFLE